MHSPHSPSDFYLSDIKKRPTFKRSSSPPLPPLSTSPTPFPPVSFNPSNFPPSSPSFLPPPKIVPYLKTGGKDSFLQGLNSNMREFYGQRKDFVRIIEDYEKMNFCLESIREKVMCYRCELGNLIKKVEEGFKKIIQATLEETMNLYSDCRKNSEKQSQEQLGMIDKLEKEKKELELKNRNLKNLFNFQESEYKICKINADAMQNELVLLHELLKKDVLTVINHLGNIENVNQKGYQVNTDPSENLAEGLTDLNKLISTLEDEQSNKTNLMGNMNNLLKAMLKGGKQDASTQVDEGELVWKPNLILPRHPLANKEILNNNIDVLKQMERELSKPPLPSPTLPQPTKDQPIVVTNEEKGLLGENWNLSITLIVFLENVTRQNESGRVLPWAYFKKLIFEVYKERVKVGWEMKGSIVEPGIQFDEFLCLYFLKTHKLRRMAELKMLEFLVSLKYYYKLWPRALLLANFLNISQYSKAIPEPNFSYDFDIYLLEFFLNSFAKLMEMSNAFEETQDGVTIISREKADSFINSVPLYGLEVRRIQIRLAKFTKKGDNDVEGIDVDRILECIVDEYFELRKKNLRSLAKSFGKAYEGEHGLFSLEDIKQIVSEVVDVDSGVEGQTFAGELHKTRLFFSALTASKNKFDIINKDFLIVCSKFGIDCPYPFFQPTAKISQDKIAEGLEISKMKRVLEGLDSKKKKGREEGGGRKEDEEEEEREKEGAGVKRQENVKEFDREGVKMDGSSSLFAQHFSILRELRHYCLQLKDAVKTEGDMEVVWKHLDNIVNILDIGCQFLNFPIQI